MPDEEKKETSSTENQKIGDLSDRQAETVLDIIQSFNGTLINIRRYPPGSATVKMALDKGRVAFESIFDDLNSFTISEDNNAILIEHEMLGPKLQSKAYIVSFIQQIRARNIRSITFSKGITSDELETFLRVLSATPEEIKKIEDINAHMAEKGVEHIEIDKRVFVALEKGQAIANKSDLERLIQGGGSSLGAKDVKDGMFLSFLLSKIPMRDFNIEDSKLEKLKEQIDYSKLKEAANIDFEKLGPLLAASIERMMDIDKAGDVPAAKDGKGETVSIVQHQAVLSKLKEQNSKIKKLTESFNGVNEIIGAMPNKEMRSKYLKYYIKIVAGFKLSTLTQLMTTKLPAGSAIDLKRAVLNDLPTDKKVKVSESIVKKLTRLMEGLNPEDFEYNPKDIQESEDVLKKVAAMSTGTQEKSHLSDKVQRGVSVARLIMKEAKSEESLLILKMRRIIIKPPEFFLQPQFLDNFNELSARLSAANRQDIINKLLDRVAENLDAKEKMTRISAVKSFIKIQQSLFESGNVLLINSCFNHLYANLQKEQDDQIFAVILAAIVSSFSRLVEGDNFLIAGNIIRSMQKLETVLPRGSKREILEEGLSRVLRDKNIIDMLLDNLLKQADVTNDSLVKLLLSLPPESILPQLLHLLKESDEMRVRKKCIILIGKYKQGMINPILQELSREQPWYYLRNLINLITAVPDSRSLEAIANNLKHGDERVRRACVSALIKNGNETAQNILIDVLEDQDESIMRMAISYFSQSRAHVAAVPLMQLLADKNLVETKILLASEIIQALGRIGHPDSTDVLIDLVHKKGLKGLFGKRNDEILLAVLKALADLKDEKGAAFAKKFTRDRNTQVARAAQLAVVAVSD